MINNQPNVNVINLFGDCNQQRGYLKDRSNDRSPINNKASALNMLKDQLTHTPKSMSRPTSREQKIEKKDIIRNTKPASMGQQQDIQSMKALDYQKIKSQAMKSINKQESTNKLGCIRFVDQVEKKDQVLKSFLKNLNITPTNLKQHGNKKEINLQACTSQDMLSFVNSTTCRKQQSILLLNDESFQQVTEKIQKANFNFHYVIGKGGFGKVWKVESKKDRRLYAMKEMSKSKIIAKRSVQSVMNEKNLLQQLKHGFIVNMSQAFQDRENLYLVMDLMTGGDLRYHIGKQRRFKEHQTRFFCACILLSLEYLHNKNVIHRDLKPENIVLDSEGYAYLTDLGIARQLRAENSTDTSGTPGYMAPEVMCRQNHGISVDYFALGVIVYEFMMGRRPYQGRSRNEIRDQILAKQAHVKKSDLPEDYSMEAADFANKLLQRKAVNRLGFNGPDEVKSHPWLRDFPWSSLQKKQLISPYIPINIDTNTEYREQISIDQIESNEDLINQNYLLLRRDSVQNLFNGYEEVYE